MEDSGEAQPLGDLADILGDAVILPGSEEYQQANESYFSASENELRPWCISILSGACRVAIRGAGHTPFAENANIDGGVTIDMRRLKGVTLSEDKSIVKIGVGETWSAVYAELEKHGLTTPGGRVGRIWVAGFVLGGGLNNFGTGRITYYASSTFSQLVEKACDFVENESDLDTYIMCSVGYGFKQQAVSCVIFANPVYHTKVKENHLSLQLFTRIEPQIQQMCSMRMATQREFSEGLSKFSTDGMRLYWTTITIRAKETLFQIKDAEGFIFSFGFDPLTKALLENYENAGGNAAAIRPSDGPLFVLLINPIWALPEDDGGIFKAVGELVTELKRLARERGLLHRYVFTNYGHCGDRALSGYSEESVKKLVATSKRVDPLGIIQPGVSGGFKLPPARGS
ncbi:FAD-binding domain-containing protein [Xylaria bambusicola]|uniref:FAD-binding domain-containing protein n=1 Tax=Xylaria bambusicola TaxID=326684 RepID=UPI00200813E7|nr:FAD-binding domain-containing protein [Xylaria bambusicola]KAI0503101.1 FAD-binding domain-containing protein [Xylaria bambusicola]